MSEINMSLLNDFIDESREHLDEMESLLLRLGDEPGNLDILNDIFRTMHNIKGTSQLTGLEKISKLSHRLEDLLDLLRQEKMLSNAGIVETLIAGRDLIVQLVGELEDSQQEASSVDDLVDQLTALIEGADTTASDEASAISTESESTPQAESAPEPEPEPVSEASIDTASVTVTTLSMDYEEENDEELFRIFIEHLHEQLASLVSTSAQLNDSPDQAEGLSHCSDVIKRLLFSANYMGYEALTGLYDRWQAELGQASESLSRSEPVSLAFMQDYFDELGRAFPQLQDIKLAEVGEMSVEATESAEEDITAAVLEAFMQNQDEFEPEAEVEPELESEVESAIERARSKISLPLVGDFIDESREHLDEMESLLLRLGDEPGNLDILNDIFRTMHNIKGTSQLTGLEKISKLSHRLEDLLDLLRQEKMLSNAGIVETLIAGRDQIVRLVGELEDSQQEVSSVDDLVDQLTALIEGADTTSSDKTSALPSEQESASALMSNVTLLMDYEEEHDQELFGIFIEHLHEQFAFLVSASEQLKDTPDLIEQLARCSDHVKRLRSSANYMGYEALTGLYDRWHVELAQVSESALRKEPASLVFMGDYFDELAGAFPQLQDIKFTARSVVVVSPPEPAEAKVEDSSPELTEIKVSTDELKDNELFNRLNNALETSLQKVSRSEYETLNDVFDELVSSQEKGKEINDEAKAVVAKKASSRSMQQQKLDQQSKSGNTREKKVKKTLRVDAEKIDALMNQVGELVVDRSYFFQLFNEMRELQHFLKDRMDVDQKELKLFRAFTYRLSEAISSLGRTSNELQEGVMKMRMLPISHLFNRYPRLVHDLTRNIDKKVNLVVRGEDTELDKMIVEELSDPLIHIIRNAIDHGLESTEDRMSLGKADAGKLELEAYQESNHIVIEVTDDGRGIDPRHIKEKAISKEVLSSEEIERMSNRDVINLIMTPGFSTAEKITGTSGRGVGMDVVKKNIEKLNGTLEIDSIPGKRTQMRLKIPLTLAIIHALMIRVGRDMFTIPLANVDETVRIDRYGTSTVEGVEVIYLRGVALPIFRLSKLFNVPADEDAKKSFVVIVNTDGQRIGFVVDELLGQEEVVIKPLEDYVQVKSGFSGATIVGDGRISLILDVYELVKMTANKQISRQKQQANALKSGKLPRPHMGEGLIQGV